MVVQGQENESFWVTEQMSGMLKKRASRTAICVMVVAINAVN